MSSKGDIYLGASGDLKLLSPYGRKLTISDTEISRSERAVSGKLRKDIIAVKKRITLDYSFIDGDALETLLDIYDLQSELVLRIYTADYETTTTTASPGSTIYYDEYTVLMEPIDRTRVLLMADGLWSGVSVVLEEV